MKTIIKIGVLITGLLFSNLLISQPWKNALRICQSTDGINFSTSQVFQDSAGVPCLVKWKGDTLIAVFQWFRLPNPSPTWDRVAAKFSYDNGQTWSAPQPLVFPNWPSGFQRAFDPSLVVYGGDSLRLYFSSSATMPLSLDSTVNTYSAWSVDGINFNFENNPRVDVLNAQVIDPSVIRFNNSWHYVAPSGPPQAGAYHYVSPDGRNFSAVPKIPSDNNHNWTGNYMIESAAELRFYGSGSTIWYNSSVNGGVWNGFVSTNIQGGDPAVLKTSSNNYIMVFVGAAPLPNQVLIKEEFLSEIISIYPLPVSQTIKFKTEKYFDRYVVLNATGAQVLEGEGVKAIDVEFLPSGIYFLKIFCNTECKTIKFIKSNE